MLARLLKDDLSVSPIRAMALPPKQAQSRIVSSLRPIPDIKQEG
jgi:hypothetical protein